MAAGKTDEEGLKRTTPETKRTRIPLMETFGTVLRLRNREWVWVVFADAIAYIQLVDDWIITRQRASVRLLKQLSKVPRGGRRETPDKMLIFTRDGILLLKQPAAMPFGGGVPGTINIDSVITGERVKLPHDPEDQYSSIDIVRVNR